MAASARAHTLAPGAHTLDPATHTLLGSKPLIKLKISGALTRATNSHTLGRVTHLKNLRPHTLEAATHRLGPDLGADPALFCVLLLVVRANTSENGPDRGNSLYEQTSS